MLFRHNVHRSTDRGTRMTEDDSAAPSSFWIVSGVALLWNFLGFYIFVTEISMTEETLMTFTEAQRMVYVNMPSWATATHATAVTMGVVGCLLLLFRRALAVLCFGLSLAALIIQTYYAFVFIDSVEIFGGSSAIVSSVVFITAIALLLYAIGVKEKGWIS